MPKQNSHQSLDLVWEEAAVGGADSFRLRSAALLIHAQQILLVHNLVHDFYYTVGGAVRHGESSLEAVAREVREETGLTLRHSRLVFLYEVFYQDQLSESDLRCHEINLFYLHELTQEERTRVDAKIHETKSGSERGLDLPSGETLEWLDFAALSDKVVFPSFLPDRLLRPLPEQFEHVVEGAN
ncbi:NUDIX hydrolase [Boudabousia marimammalium]|uniref:Nudix hydrolase domain-containing protein n=1 Tax=Boudabousia marimammalium TaxID=156892 RepID=A0A1Q5PNY1_9ACTO|nr:NUDIX domain-containing protein [Boudabousia marimammalium]OKL49284.1 hypothetical protein BM477_04690 [Boudabousia marimammalium]